ncbi:MAG: class I SAM-dependent methyltransferase [Planctomycetota bacterium]
MAKAATSPLRKGTAGARITKTDAKSAEDEPGWYESPRYYDAVFDVDTNVEADFLEAVFERHADRSPRARRRSLEPACGSGRLLAALAERGWNVHGFDLEPEMVRYSRERLRSAGLSGTAVRGDMADFRARGSFDLAHCLVSTFKYLLREEDARAHLACIARALRPGGVYALGFHLSDYAAGLGDRESWSVKSKGLSVRCTITSDAPDRRTRTERVESRLRLDEDGSRRELVTRWRFRTYDAAQVKRLLRSVPELEHVATYDFHYEVDEPQEFGDHQCDTLLVLKRR